MGCLMFKIDLKRFISFQTFHFCKICGNELETQFDKLSLKLTQPSFSGKLKAKRFQKNCTILILLKIHFSENKFFLRSFCLTNRCSRVVLFGF